MNDLAEGVLPVAYAVSNDLVKASSLLPSNRKRSLLVHSLISCMETVLDATTNAEFGLEDDCPTFLGLPDYVQLIAGATLAAADALKEGISDIALCWDGGRHHAQRSHAAGFCYVADCILAIIYLRKIPPNYPQPSIHKPRVLYLDLDLHFSDAVSQAFFSPGASAVSQTLTLSIHHTAPGFFPISQLAELPSPEDPTFDPFTLSLPLKQGASDRTFAKIWPIVNRVRNTFMPDFTVVQCGVDTLAGDPCAVFNLSLGGRQGSLGWCIEQILTWPGKKLFLGGGGYNSPNTARAWTYLTSIMLGKPLNLEAEIPDHSGFPLYGPSFTLDIPAGNMQDLNDDQYLLLLESRYDAIVQSLEKRLHS
ncbi:histone deacetylase complex protein [Infundibulicybe gibba]|nr:histone deacetylase complex protein [Infundibulicybe gibba]